MADMKDPAKTAHIVKCFNFLCKFGTGAFCHRPDVIRQGAAVCSNRRYPQENPSIDPTPKAKTMSDKMDTLPKSRTDASRKVLEVLIVAEGISGIMELLQHTIEKMAQDYANQPEPEQNRAPALFRAAETVEKAVFQIRETSKL